MIIGGGPILLGDIPGILSGVENLIVAGGGRGGGNHCSGGGAGGVLLGTYPILLDKMNFYDNYQDNITA